MKTFESEIKRIKRISAIFTVCAFLFWPITIVLIGCVNTPPDRIAYNTIGSVEDTATAAYRAYTGLVVTKVVGTNNLHEASVKFSQIQSAVTLAATTAENGTNALAPASLTIELNDLLALLHTISNTNK